MSDDNLTKNVKVGLYFLTLVPPVVHAVLGAYCAIRDAIKRIKGIPTNTQIAVQETAKKLVGETLTEMFKEQQKRYAEEEALIQKELGTKKC